MAQLIGGLATSHIPAIGGAIHKGKQNEPYWKPFFDGFPPIHQWLGKVKPDVVVVFYNDHGLNFFLDKMPTFAVGAAASYSNADEGWGIPTLPPVQGCPELSWHLIRELIAKEFDIVTCQEMLVDHACTCRSSCSGRARGGAGADRADRHQHGAVSRCPQPSASTSWARRWARPSRAGTATSGWW
jgi:hypothetical protein